MSSSNNKIYCGIVYRTKNFAAQCRENPEGEYLYQAFREYWDCGFSPSIGKDVLFARPDEAMKLHIRHAHTDSGDYEPEDSDKHHSAKESTWLKWRNGFIFRVPTSNSYLIYAVNENRDALVMDYIDRDAHSVTESAQYMDQYIEITYSFLAFTKCKEMPYDEDVYHEKWLLTNQDTTD
ncbi:hypothetical protein OW293_014765 [Providencia rettgeri]|nr:hypothetical protein [Providencia rettgeri]